MDSVFAFGYDRDQFCQAGRTRINYFQAATGDKPGIMDGKDDGIKYGLVLFIEGAIYENIIVV